MKTQALIRLSSFNLPTIILISCDSFLTRQKLTIHIPFSNDVWFSQVFQSLKEHPYHMPKSANNKKDDKNKNNQGEVTMDTTETDHPADRTQVQLTGP